ncbi:MAG TPA: hypothetical protein EYP40_03020, partial [Chromatiales bacterium]|nr:hypothetical protein [Chromatiales bacterium]
MSPDPPFSQRRQRSRATPAGLPAPGPDARRHSDRLAALIRGTLEQQGGVLSFRDFMQLALYAPGLGYYSAGSRKLGGEGDFITAPEIAPLFSRTLARAVAPVLARLPEARILEAGFNYDTRDRWFVPTRGMLHRLDTELAVCITKLGATICWFRLRKSITGRKPPVDLGTRKI